jgi:uncharacterized protein YdiU (UPF0061 family)
MQTLQTLPSENAFSGLPESYFSYETPQALSSPELVIHSDECAALLDLDSHSLHDPQSLQILSGQSVPEQWKPLAMKYFGHQFGYLNPELGDGRGLLMAQYRNQDGKLWDLHLKGSGTTPYSRGGDGRAVLRSCIREFLASEALHALGIPSTRALAVVVSDTPVYRETKDRETKERAAALLRVAKTHIRFGHFEFAYHSGDKRLLTALLDYSIAHHFPSLNAGPKSYPEVYHHICKATASMIAKWQCQGFAHGVMNSDNMSIVGDTFDFGPYGFMDRFRAGYICNHSDQHGRYAFDQQPAIAHWNLSVLAQALSPLVKKEALAQGLRLYAETFNQEFMSGMGDKLGISATADDQDFVMHTLQMLSDCRMDYSNFFRLLSAKIQDKGLQTLRDQSFDIKRFDEWVETYNARSTQERLDWSERNTTMRASNPRAVLRNHLALEAVEAAEKGNYSVLNRLHQRLKTPFEKHPEDEHFKKLPPDWAENLEISCSS